MAETEKSEWRGRLALISAVLILICWTISFLVDLYVQTYDPPASVTPLAVVAAGFLFGTETMASLSVKPREDKPKSPEPEEVKP